MKSVLIHSCCAHCAAYTVQYWREQRYEVSALWYNPNIHPYMEHQYRLEAMQSLAQEMNLPLTVIEGYGVIDYFRKVADMKPSAASIASDFVCQRRRKRLVRWALAPSPPLC